jgi:cyclic pyranopterin phosphate synthase
MEEGPVNGLTHVDAVGRARMADVSGKEVTARSAGASGRVLLSAEAVAALRAGEVPKGDAPRPWPSRRVNYRTMLNPRL